MLPRGPGQADAFAREEMRGIAAGLLTGLKEGRKEEKED
jgi:hypothetical protein